MENNAFEKLYADLKSGYSFGKDFTWNHYENKPMRYPYFDKTIFYDPIKHLFCVRHFGSFAIKSNKKELKWLLSEIFKCSAAEFLEKYIRNDESKIA